MPERKHDKDTARFADLESRVALLENLHGKELADQEFRRQERARMQREKQAWRDALPERLESLQQFLDKRCVVGRGRSIFVGFLRKAYSEFASDSEADSRMPTREEIARAEQDAVQRGERNYRFPERPAAIPLDHELVLTGNEFEAAVLDLSDVTVGEGVNNFGTTQPIYKNLCLRDAFEYPGSRPHNEPEYSSTKWVPVG